MPVRKRAPRVLKLETDLSQIGATSSCIEELTAVLDKGSLVAQVQTFPHRRDGRTDAERLRRHAHFEHLRAKFPDAF